MKINFRLKDVMLTMPKIVKSVAQVFSFNSKIQKRFVPETFTPSLILWIIKSKKHLLIEIADRSIL